MFYLKTKNKKGRIIIKKFFIIFLGLLVIIATFLSIKVYTSIRGDKIDIVEKEEYNKEETIDIVLPEIKYEEEIKEDIYNEENIYEEEQIKEEIINIVLVGMDAREGEKYSRSDSIILLSYNKTNHIVKMISFLRDTWVYLPERGWNKINAATAYGGTGLLVNTLNENFDLDVQNYIQIKFNGFKEVIDILGGIDIKLSDSEIKYINEKLHTEDKDWNNDITSPAGIVHLNGTQTLWHCRNRTIGEGDFSRTNRQREVLERLIDKAMNMSATQLVSLIYEMKDYVNTNIPIDVLIEIAEDALISKNLIIESGRIPIEGLYRHATKNGVSVLEIDIEGTKNELHYTLGLM